MAATRYELVKDSWLTVSGKGSFYIKTAGSGVLFVGEDQDKDKCVEVKKNEEDDFFYQKADTDTELNPNGEGWVVLFTPDV